MTISPELAGIAATNIEQTEEEDTEEEVEEEVVGHVEDSVIITKRAEIKLREKEQNATGKREIRYFACGEKSHLVRESEKACNTGMKPEERQMQ